MVILENENSVFNLGNILLFARESLETRKMNLIPLLVITKYNKSKATSSWRKNV